MLSIPYHKLKTFEEEADPLAAILNYWLNGNVEDVPATWKSLVAALEADSVGEGGLAKTIMGKYCQSEPVRNKGMYIERSMVMSFLDFQPNRSSYLLVCMP